MGRDQREYQKQWYQKNKERLRDRVRLRNKAVPLETKLYQAAKSRAKQMSREFSIDLEDISIPEKCPILGIELRRGEGRSDHNSPSLDRVDSQKGYSKNNILVMSWRANTLKKDATLDELIALGEWAKEIKNGID